MNNSISLEITPEQEERIKAALAELDEALKPFLIALTKRQRKLLPKMGYESLPFVEKAVDYCDTNPEFAAFVDVPELRKDLLLYQALSPTHKLLVQLVSDLSDTLLLAGSECMIASLGYYQSLKAAIKLNKPKAKAIFNDLFTRFESQGKRAKKS